MCESLEIRLNRLPLQELRPPLTLIVVDIDSSEVSDSDRNRYNLQVPVLVLEYNETGAMVELPRVSPRLKEEALIAWLVKMLEKYSKN